MRYYYTDKLKAAWMAKEYGFRLYYLNRHNENNYCDWEYIAERLLETKYYIHEDSIPLLQPQVGDIILDNDNEPRAVCKIKDNLVFWPEEEDYGYCYIPSIEIIQRDKKAWFNPEVES